MPFTMIRQDITKMDVDAVVNAANTGLRMGGGVCGAIFHAAGAAKLQAACLKRSPIRTGEAVVTPGYGLTARYIIHAVGPVYGDYAPDVSRRLLADAYLSALTLAKEKRCNSIAFPLISSGIYGYPKAEALEVAVDAIRTFLSSNDMDVYLVIFDRDAVQVGETLMGAVRRYIDDTYVELHECRRAAAPAMLSATLPTAAGVKKSGTKSLDDRIAALDEPFNRTLLRLIDEKGKTDAEVYKRANLDRKLFSKIRTGKGYLPGKRTILALAVALELTLPETDDLLRCAGYALSHSHKFDVIVEYFIVSGNYDIFAINEVLFSYDQPLLGGN